MAIRIALSAFVIFLMTLTGSQAQDFADSKEKAAVASDEDGKYFDEDGSPTFNIEEDGTVDWYTFSGYRRFNSDCHVCHGPDGVGSTYAPALVDSIKRLDYGNFVAIVAEGRTIHKAGQESVMPAFGDNKNVYCYLDDLYVYLRARAVGDLPRGRPGKRQDKPESAQEFEDSCMGG